MKTWVTTRLGASPPLVSADAQTLPKGAIFEIENAADKHAKPASPPPQRTTVPVAQLLAPVAPGVKSTLLSAGSLPGGRAAFKLGDRVVTALTYGSVPFGQAGTVVGYSENAGWVDVLLDIWCLGGTTLQGR